LFYLLSNNYTLNIVFSSTYVFFEWNNFNQSNKGRWFHSCWNNVFLYL